jgi:hypothetical protein
LRKIILFIRRLKPSFLKTNQLVLVLLLRNSIYLKIIKAFVLTPIDKSPNAFDYFSFDYLDYFLSLESVKNIAFLIDEIEKDYFMGSGK